MLHLVCLSVPWSRFTWNWKTIKSLIWRRHNPDTNKLWEPIWGQDHWVYWLYYVTVTCDILVYITGYSILRIILQHWILLTFTVSRVYLFQLFLLLLYIYCNCNCSLTVTVIKIDWVELRERKCKNRFLHVFVKSGSIYISPRPKYCWLHFIRRNGDFFLIIWYDWFLLI